MTTRICCFQKEAKYEKIYYSRRVTGQQREYKSIQPILHRTVLLLGKIDQIDQLVEQAAHLLGELNSLCGNRTRCRFFDSNEQSQKRQ